jgi:uncharacterized ferritin-like protein (DUF455 family)
MELREFAERVLFATTLDDKLSGPALITDEHPGAAVVAPKAPGRPAELCFKDQGRGLKDFPGAHRLEGERERGLLLHFFANHELLAVELMALVLLKFPDAPAAFRRGVWRTLQEEQEHTRLYLRRMKECGIQFGELPVSGYFWRTVAGMESPMDYVAGLSLTFEQANLDYCRQFAGAFGAAGDDATARLLERIYRDEIGHVAYGLKWFRRWRNPRESDWEAFCRQLKFPLSPQRAKGVTLNVEGRRKAGLDEEFINELSVYSHSRGRTPVVFVFNPFVELRIAQGRSFTPTKHQATLVRDLANLPQFLCRQDDVVLVPKRPSLTFLSAVKQAGFPLPEFVELKGQGIDERSSLRQRKLGGLRPWAWGPDAIEMLQPLFAHVTGEPIAAVVGPDGGEGRPEPSPTLWRFNERIARLHSKAWSAEFLKKVLSKNGDSSWLCGLEEAGEVVSTIEGALAAVERLRRRGNHNVVVKKAYGLAGQGMIRLWEPRVLEKQRRWMETSLEKGQRLVVEPWLERVLDFSVQLEMTRDGLKLCGYTGLINDTRGQFQANWADSNAVRRVPGGLPAAFKGRLHEFEIAHGGHDLSVGRDSVEPTFERSEANAVSVLRKPGNRDARRARTASGGKVGSTESRPTLRFGPANFYGFYQAIFTELEPELATAGYLGPLGIDAFIYRAVEGSLRLKPIVEINLRQTMGRLTLELMKHTCPGCVGEFRLVNRAMARSEGCENFLDYARALARRTPLQLAGSPVPKIRAGELCLNDPAEAREYLAVFRVGREFPGRRHRSAMS